MNLKAAIPCLLLLLAACATAPVSGREDYEAPEKLTSWEQAQEDPSCVVLLCEEERCGLWRCGELRALTDEEVRAAEQARASQERQVVRTRGPLVLRPPVSWTNSSRYWGYPVALPGDSEPVFEIPWHNWKERSEAERLAKLHWRSFHAYLHSGGPKGGMWNEAWRQFQDQNRRTTAEEMWRFAGELMKRFRIHGEFVPYCERPASGEERDR